jgi:succinyl-diaminopimelate desuccinylase
MEQQLKDTLRDLVAIPSVSNNIASNQAALDYIHSQFEPLGFIIDTHFNQDRSWMTISTKATKEPDILLAAHIDVVPGDDSMFKLREENGKLIGRGVFDMKFAAACYIELAKRHSDSLRDLNIAFYFTTDEEIGGHSVTDFLALGWRPKCVLLPDGAGDWQVEARAKGLHGIRLEATGTASHASRPWEGDNALHRITDACQALRQSYPHKGPGDATLSITCVKGGEVINQIPGSAYALIDFRSYNKRELAAFKDEVIRLAAQYEVTPHFTQDGNPVIFDKDHPRVQSFLEILASMTEKPIEYIDSYGGSDARYFAKYDIPCIITEPRGGGRHADNEWLLADDLLSFYMLIECWVVGRPKK